LSKVVLILFTIKFQGFQWFLKKLFLKW